MQSNLSNLTNEKRYKKARLIVKQYFKHQTHHIRFLN